MKKILMISLITMLTYCSSTGTISPPSWTTGTWIGSTGPVTKLVFSEDNIVKTLSGSEVDFKETYVDATVGITYTIEEESTDTSYTVTVTPDTFIAISQEHKFVLAGGVLTYTLPIGDASSTLMKQ